MDDDHGDAIGIAALLDIDAMCIANIKHPLIEGLDRRVKELDCALLACGFIHN